MSTATASRKSACGYLAGLKRQLLGLLQQGLEPRQLALALALGATIGLLPTVWGTSLLCLLVAALLRVNQLAVQLANYLVYPLQLLLFFPYFKLGGKLFSSHHLPESFANLHAQLLATPWAVVKDYWQANLEAVFVWLLSTPLLLAGGFLLSLLLVKQLRSPVAD